MSGFGMIHYNLPGMSLTEVLDFARDAGYEHMELQITDVWPQEEGDPERAAENLRKELDARGLKAAALAASNDFVVLDPEVVEAQVRRMERVCDLAAILGAHVIRTEGGQPKDEVDESQWVEAISGCLKQCLDFAEEGDFYFAVDNHGYITNDAELQIAVFEEVGSERVGANLDTMNYRWRGHSLETVYRFYRIIAPYVLHTHLKDGTGSLGEYRGTALGEGELDLQRAIDALKEAGYQGIWCAEYEAREDSREGYRKCLAWMKENT